MQFTGSAREPGRRNPVVEAGRKTKKGRKTDSVAEFLCDRVADAYVQATRLKASAPVLLQVSNIRSPRTGTPIITGCRRLSG